MFVEDRFQRSTVKIVALVQPAGEENLSMYRHGYPGKKQNTKIALKNLFFVEITL